MGSKKYNLAISKRASAQETSIYVMRQKRIIREQLVGTTDRMCTFGVPEGRRSAPNAL